MFLPFRFSPYSFDCYIFLIILLIESSFSINFLNILYHFFNWIIFSIASLNILVHFILCQIWVLFSWLIFILFLILSYWNFFFFILFLNISFTGILLTFRVTSLKNWTRFVQIFFSFRLFFTIDFFFLSFYRIILIFFFKKK